jgi:hypothetical protein
MRTSKRSFIGKLFFCGTFLCAEIARAQTPDLVRMHDAAASVPGQAKNKAVVRTMALVFERWAKQWLKHASAASA